MEKGGKDLKTLNLVFEYLANIAAAGKDFSKKIVNETCVLECIGYLVEHQEAWHQDILESVYRLLDYMFEHIQL